MKSSFSVTVALLIATLMLFCSCGTQSTQPVPSSPTSQTVSIPPVSVPDVTLTSTPNDTATPAKVTISVTDADGFAAAACRYVDTDLAATWYVSIAADQPITQFKWLALDESEVLRIERVLHTVEQLDANTPFCVQTYINDVSANRGICYVDTTGKTVFCAIRCSGQDGSLYLEPFTVGM